MIKTIQDVKKVITRQLLDMGFEKIDKQPDILPKKLSNLYLLIQDDIEIFVALDKDGDKNCIEFRMFSDNQDGTMNGAIAYDLYTDLLMYEKEEKGYIKAYVITTVNRLINSIK